MKYVAGAYAVGGTTLYVNRGFGTVGRAVARRRAARSDPLRSRRCMKGATLLA